MIVLILNLFFYWYEFLFLTLAAGAAPRVGQFLKGSAGRDVLLGIALFRVVGVFAGAFELCHNRIVLGLERGEPRPFPMKKKFICVAVRMHLSMP